MRKSEEEKKQRKTNEEEKERAKSKHIGERLVRDVTKTRKEVRKEKVEK